MYPRLFVALVYTPQSGLWLMATPEILLKGEQNQMATMSLAGTQKAEPSKTVADYPVEGVEWSEKNREEQQYVTDYIEDCIKVFSDEYQKKGPYTTMAANLYHLRTDIAFRLHDTGRLGDVLDALYPTPAVCGIPKDEARRFILQHEHQSRKYYSGFVGPISPKGKTHLYVSLRCMNILDDGSCELYAGGGLLKESEMEKEWKETEAKMQTILSVL
jgi:isochorismate synthase